VLTESAMSPGPAKTESPSRLSAPYYVWQVPGKKLAIHLYFDVVDRMNYEVMQGFGALPRRGAEVGGVLLGRVDSSGDDRLVYVEDCEPVPCEYNFGPSYNLTEREQEAIGQVLERWKPGPDRRISVVGFYRSHTRKDLFLDERDLAVCSAHFSDPSSVFLVVKPFATRSALAGFFFWEDGQIHSEAPYSEFTFHRRDLGGGDPRPVRPSFKKAVESVPVLPAQDGSEVQTEPVVSADAAEQSDVPQFAVAPRASIPRWLWGTVLAVLLAGGGYMGFRAVTDLNVFRRSEPVQPSLPIALAVRENDRQLAINWNRASPAILTARKAVLSISDGPAIQKEIELNGDELRLGSVVYSRVTGDVRLKLEVVSEDGRSVSESMRVLKSGEMTEPATESMAGRQPEASPAGLVQAPKPQEGAPPGQAGAVAAAKTAPPPVKPPEPKPAAAKAQPQQVIPAPVQQSGEVGAPTQRARRVARPPAAQAAKPLETQPPEPKPASAAVEEVAVPRPERRR